MKLNSFLAEMGGNSAMKASFRADKESAMRAAGLSDAAKAALRVSMVDPSYKTGIFDVMKAEGSPVDNGLVYTTSIIFTSISEE